jgi:1-deoxy-D-xylulose-5-phosphate reductoisomerase
MRGPIAYGLSWPERVISGAAALDFSAMSGLSFEAINTDEHKKRFPGIGLAWTAMDGPQGTTAVLNAANEIAVAAFLERRIRYDQIHHINTETLSSVRPAAPSSLDDLLGLDIQSRRAAEAVVSRVGV